jgi:hypothetical protein
MVNIGRNNPCPCKSGKKHKFCCLKHAKTADPAALHQLLTVKNDPEWFSLREAEGIIEEILDQYIAHKLTDEIEEMWDEFEIYSEHRIDREVYAPLFKNWSQHSWTSELTSTLTSPNATVATQCLEEHPTLFTPYQKRVIKAIHEAPFSFLIVQDVIRDQRLFLRDIMLQKEVVVKEHKATHVLKKGKIIFGRSVTLDGQSIMAGMFPFSLPGTVFNEIAEYRDSLLQDLELSAFTAEELIDYDMELRELYFNLIEANSQPIRFSNTDGDPVNLNEMVYDLKCTPREAFEALRPLCPPKKAGTWEKGEFDAEGNLVHIDVHWLRPGKDDDDGICSYTSIGNFTITQTTLKVFVNSNERARRAKALVHDFLGSKVALKSHSKTPMANSNQVKKTKKKSGPVPEPKEPDANMKQILKDYAARHWKAWLDREIPALGGLTPHQATKSKSGREKLEALLLELEGRNQTLAGNGNEYQQVDVNHLRQELGMAWNSN